MLKLVAFGVIAMTLTGCGELPYTNINNQQLQQLLAQGTPLYDVRRADEWIRTGYIEGSELLTFADASDRVIPGFIDELTAKTGPNEPIILICDTGGRTRTLARYLANDLGYTQVYNVRNGISQWIREDLPVQKVN